MLELRRPPWTLRGVESHGDDGRFVLTGEQQKARPPTAPDVPLNISGGNLGAKQRVVNLSCNHASKTN